MQAFFIVFSEYKARLLSFCANAKFTLKEQA